MEGLAVSRDDPLPHKRLGLVGVPLALQIDEGVLPGIVRSGVGEPQRAERETVIIVPEDRGGDGKLVVHRRPELVRVALGKGLPVGDIGDLSGVRVIIEVLCAEAPVKENGHMCAVGQHVRAREEPGIEFQPQQV